MAKTLTLGALLLALTCGVAAASPADTAVANGALKASGADVSMLKNLGGKLEKSCARNKYGLSEAECVDRINRRGDLCANQTATRFPGQIGNTERMQVVVQAYVGCIFEQPAAR
ncbi:hypothetical protein SAMN05518865_12641 [Duganella sp. CF458]|uniref:hypothetical protein n=1 Tax=Duganella sp. CF458 TaxID=1884368 RepID=UPI0008EDED97|nr:hypothetical protein [Duganella sp. CF458]SFG97732.1 hypothetical protein SAMN05518865_12641 [Duganella sp. CF458]